MTKQRTKEECIIHIKKYGTVLGNCTCLGYKSRKYCYGHTYLLEQQSKQVGKIKILDGTDVIVALQQYGDETIEGMLKRFELYEQDGCLFNVK